MPPIAPWPQIEGTPKSRNFRKSGLDGKALGMAHFFADPNKLRAEYAIAMRSDWKGRGLAYLLMTRLIDIARQRGIGELVGEVLRRMSRCCRCAASEACPSLPTWPIQV